MKLSIIILIVGVCMVSAKYLPDDWDNSGQLLSRFKRFDLGDSDTSSDDDSDSDSNNNDSDVLTDESDIKEQSKRIASLEKMRQKLLEKQEKERQKQEEAQRKIEEKIAKELQKEEEKREKEKRKWEEKLEKERKKLEEEQRKIQEKIVENERKRQEKIQKEMEEFEKEKIDSNSSNDDDSDGDDSIELQDIWKLHIYSKYGITKDHTNMEKKAALRKYMEEELGLNANSTASERRQAVLRFIQTELQSVPNINILRSQFIDYINYVGVQKIREKLEGDIEKLKNKTETLNNVNLTWAPIAKQNLAEQVSFLESVKQFLSNLLPNWVSGSTDKPQQGLPVSNTDAVVSLDSSILTQETNAADLTNTVNTQSNVTPSNSGDSVPNSSPDNNGSPVSTSPSVVLESSSIDLEKPASTVVASETNSGTITAAETATGNSDAENKQPPTETASETVDTAMNSINELDTVGVTAVNTKLDTDVTSQSENTGNTINSEVNGVDNNGIQSLVTDSVNNNENPSETGISSTENVPQNTDNNINQSVDGTSDTTGDININKDSTNEYSKDIVTEAASVVSSSLDGSVSGSVPSSDLSETSLSSSIINENKDTAVSTSNVPNLDDVDITTVDAKKSITDTVSELSSNADNGVESAPLPGSDILEASVASKPNDNAEISPVSIDLPKIDSEGSNGVNKNISNSSTNTKEGEANEIQNQIPTEGVDATQATVVDESSVVNHEQTNSESISVQQVVNEIAAGVTEQILTGETTPQEVSTEQTLVNDVKTDSVTEEAPINPPVPVEPGASIIDIVKQ